jgi:dienelactone hydrolase
MSPAIPTIDGYDAVPFTHDGTTRTVYRAGEGPAVIVMAEMPGITPKVVEFADRLVDRGLSVWLPWLFGDPGRNPQRGTRPDLGYMARSIVPACVSKEFAAFAVGRTAPVTDWLRALARHAHEECGGPGVGAVGMCFTGGFALGMLAEPAVIAPVLSQPSLPIALPHNRRRARGDLHLSPDDVATLQRRAVDEDICVVGLRFSGDPLAPGARFDTLRTLLGDKFIGVEIDSSKGNPHGHPRAAHSVLTEHLVDVEGHPTREALDQVLDFFVDRLLPTH